MKKKILIGSLLVLTLLLLMPSIPAIQQKTIEDKAYSDLVEKFEDFDLEDLREKIEKINPKFIDYLKKLDISNLEELIKFIIIAILWGIALIHMSISMIFMIIYMTIKDFLPQVANFFGLLMEFFAFPALLIFIFTVFIL